jgi:hypothetical protein
MKIEPKANCPLNNFEPCKALDCAWFVKITGKHPQSEEQLIDEWGCSMSWLPLLMIENSQQQRSTAASVDKFKNAMIKANEMSQQVLLATVQQTGTKILEVQK